MNTQDRRGFTLIELLIVSVLGAFLVAITYQVLITNQRTYTLQNAQTQSQQDIRAGMNVLFGELRELSMLESDILAMTPTRVAIRAGRTFGLVCAVDPAGSPVRVKRMGKWFDTGDSIFVVAENDTLRSRDDTILSGLVTAVDTTQTCSGTDEAQLVTVPALIPALAADTVRPGAPMRAYTTYVYGMYALGGQNFFARASTSTIDPLVGPLPEAGVRFVYLDSLGVVTTNRAAVAQIEVTIRTISEVTDDAGDFVRDSLTTRIHLRN